MHRSSQSIASLAAALSKAQAKPVNPEKSLVATIASGHRGGPEQSFRYAPLSSGLDIVLMVAERKYRPKYCGTIAMA